MLEADLRLEQEAHLATRQLLARSTAELGRLRDSQALALVEAAKAAAWAGKERFDVAFNVSVPRARVPEKACTLRDRSKR